MTAHKPFNTSPLPVKLRVEDYLLLDRSGAFDDYARTELIEGEVLFMNAQHRPHARIKSRLYRLIAEALDQAGGRLEALVEASIAIPPHNAPEPDILVTDAPDGDGLVPLASVGLVVEVADSTVESDLGVKAALYASSGIPEYWVADVSGWMIHQMWSPGGEAFAERRQIGFGARIGAATIEGLAVETAGI